MSDEAAISALIEGFIEALNSEGRYKMTPVCEGNARRSLARYMPSAYKCLQAHQITAEEPVVTDAERKVILDRRFAEKRRWFRRNRRKPA